ncbi:unnamed protein product [Rhizophagus irregularis]|nr:unnamed protein product [Rhizophagus irregularis]
MSYLNKYTNNINFDKVIEHNITRKNFLDCLQKVKLTRSTTIQGYVECMLSAEEYNNTETFIKDYKPVLKEFDVKNEIFTYCLLLPLLLMSTKSF